MWFGFCLTNRRRNKGAHAHCIWGWLQTQEELHKEQCLFSNRLTAGRRQGCKTQSGSYKFSTSCVKLLLSTVYLAVNMFWGRLCILMFHVWEAHRLILRWQVHCMTFIYCLTCARVTQCHIHYIHFNNTASTRLKTELWTIIIFTLTEDRIINTRPPDCYLKAWWAYNNTNLVIFIDFFP